MEDVNKLYTLLNLPVVFIIQWLFIGLLALWIIVQSQFVQEVGNLSVETIDKI